MSDKWLKAATIGSIWASIEIIIGSFLHNLRIPLAGTMLSFFAVVLMVSFLRLWPERGIIWRAGLICALMKSISPSAVILGPMTGIMMEGFLMESGLLLFGVNRAGLIFGGMLAVLSALFHKAVNLLILYGTDLADLLNRMVMYAARQLRIETFDGVDLLVLLGLIYLVAGALAALTGLRLSREVFTGRSAHSLPGQNPEKLNRLFGYSERQNFSAGLLVAHMIVIVALLLGMNLLKVTWWIAPAVLYAGFCLFRYQRAMKQLMKPRFWVQMVLITLFSALFLQSMTGHRLFDRAGLEAGLMMNVRAFLVIIAFTAISTELRNPLVKALVYRQGLANLYKSVSLAFSVLPEILALTTEKRRSVRVFRTVIGQYLMRAEELFELFRNLEASLPPVQLVTGDREEGKTSHVAQMIEQLAAEGKRVSGFLAVGVHDEHGNRQGFRIRNIETGEEADFCMASGSDSWEKVGRYYINPDGLARGYAWMSQEIIAGSDVIVIDELGPLELAGRGWAPLIERILSENPKPMIWTVRRKLAGKMAVKWNVGPVTVIGMTPKSGSE